MTISLKDMACVTKVNFSFENMMCLFEVVVQPESNHFLRETYFINQNGVTGS